MGNVVNADIYGNQEYVGVVLGEPGGGRGSDLYPELRRVAFYL